jgi:ribokinase
MRVAVVGHVEWVSFGRVEHIPGPGDIVHATGWWDEPAGGGSVAAVQLVRLAGTCTFFTALGDDAFGERARAGLHQLGVRVEAVVRNAPTRRAFTFVDPSGERTITTLGERLDPHAEDPLPWNELRQADAVYFTAGDPPALRLARQAGVLVATSRVPGTIARANVALDALVGSATDPAESYDGADLAEPPALLVRTQGAAGGTWAAAAGGSGRYPAVDPPGPLVDAYGGGDSFAAGLTFALGSGKGVHEALEIAARCGAWCVAGRGPYERQLGSADL